MTKAASAAAKDLAAAGVTGAQLAWADNNGIPRSRIVPIRNLADAAVRGVGATALFAVFDTHDAITYAHPGLSTPSGDIRLVPVLERLRRLAGQRALAWAPVRQVAADGSPWPYCQRSLLERHVAAAAKDGYELRAGYELEFAVAPAGSPDIASAPGHRGPAYSPHALVELDPFIGALLRDFDDNGLAVNQLHAEYGLAQLELSLVATDPVSAADDQLLARQTIHAAAHAHGLRVSFAPIVSPAAAGNGWHLHTSLWRRGRNLLAGVPDAEGSGYLAGLLRDLPALTAVTAPSVPSTMRLRPGYFASAYAFWGVENREAPLRFVPGTELLGAGHANVELKPSDASANPYLALSVVLAAGLAGVREKLTLPEPIAEDPGTWPEERRAGVARLPSTPAEQDAALAASTRVSEALGDEILGAFRACRASDAAWAADRGTEEIVAAHLWRY
ncbi:glutamine synthetase [Amycolatopsis bartoniae]|uniref:Glutamine synthetase n=1 Tax=Amycolatopsis bartoniae TaxID=941986 RepID=A0A8H9IWY3_9PSEU|nr:glutamine synthetase family protein [Amycolatopsis bartoniae]MBB2939112.1 glutamine synthetase [Amycolatopsis bartoniae]TVT06364.1 glutamine synthetase [Amycolatopsis bartoniae]GHF64818.1 glutamine synthetase [Amycolatopsis bartoniae]